MQKTLQNKIEKWVVSLLAMCLLILGTCFCTNIQSSFTKEPLLAQSEYRVSDFNSFKNALNNAKDGDTIKLAGNITGINENLVIKSSITLDGDCKSLKFEENCNLSIANATDVFIHSVFNIEGNYTGDYGLITCGINSKLTVITTIVKNTATVDEFAVGASVKKSTYNAIYAHNSAMLDFSDLEVYGCIDITNHGFLEVDTCYVKNGVVKTVSNNTPIYYKGSTLIDLPIVITDTITPNSIVAYSGSTINVYLYKQETYNSENYYIVNSLYYVEKSGNNYIIKECNYYVSEEVGGAGNGYLNLQEAVDGTETYGQYLEVVRDVEYAETDSVGYDSDFSSDIYISDTKVWFFTNKGADTCLNFEGIAFIVIENDADVTFNGLWDYNDQDIENNVDIYMTSSYGIDVKEDSILDLRAGTFEVNYDYAADGSFGEELENGTICWAAYGVVNLNLDYDGDEPWLLIWDKVKIINRKGYGVTFYQNSNYEYGWGSVGLYNPTIEAMCDIFIEVGYPIPNTETILLNPEWSPLYLMADQTKPLSIYVNIGDDDYYTNYYVDGSVLVKTYGYDWSGISLANNGNLKMLEETIDYEQYLVLRDHINISVNYNYLFNTETNLSYDDFALAFITFKDFNNNYYSYSLPQESGVIPISNVKFISEIVLLSPTNHEAKIVRANGIRVDDFDYITSINVTIYIQIKKIDTGTFYNGGTNITTSTLSASAAVENEPVINENVLLNSAEENVQEPKCDLNEKIRTIEALDCYISDKEKALFNKNTKTNRIKKVK